VCFLASVLSALAIMAGACGRDVVALQSGRELREQLAQLDFRALCQRPVTERISIPEAAWEEGYGVQRWRAVPQSLLDDVRAAIQALPQPLARAFDRHVCSVVFFTGFRVTGSIERLARDPSRGIILLNIDNLDRSADSWMSFKENSFFAENAGLGIVGRLSPADAESRRAHIDYVLIHELGHILDHVLGDNALGGSDLIERFRQISWPRTDPYRDSRLIPYADIRGDAPLGDGEAEALYDVIAASSFPSLTSAMNAGEDFADSLAIYAHEVLLGRPWQVEVYRDGELARRLDSCWNEPRCAEKRGVLEALLEQLGR
jgi:hypothetical protein